MVRNSWALTWSLEAITIPICTSESGTCHCSGKKHVWAEGTLFSNVLLDVCGSRKDRHEGWEKGEKRQQEGELKQTFGVWPIQKLRVWTYTSNWLLGAENAEQVWFSLSDCIYFCGCRQRQRILCEEVVSQPLLGTTGLGEISIYGVEGSLLTLCGWKQISCLYLVKSCCSVTMGCIRKPWTFLLDSGELCSSSSSLFALSLCLDASIRFVRWQK